MDYSLANVMGNGRWTSPLGLHTLSGQDYKLYILFDSYIVLSADFR